MKTPLKESTKLLSLTPLFYILISKRNQESYLENAFPIKEIRNNNFKSVYEIVSLETGQGYVFRKKR